MKRSISLFPKCSTTTEEEEEACGNKHTIGGWGLRGWESLVVNMRRALSLRKVMK
jgi:hypothetical protein